LHARRDGIRQPRADAQQRDDEEDDPGDEHRPEPQLPTDAHRGEAERDERVLAHVRRDRQRAVGVQAHQERAEHRDEDGRHGARPDRQPGEGQDGRTAGLTTTMYAVAANVVTPPSTSVRAVVPRSRSRKKRSIAARTGGSGSGEWRAACARYYTRPVTWR